MPYDNSKQAENEYFKDQRTPKESQGDLDLSGKREAIQKLREFAAGKRSGASLGVSGGDGLLRNEISVKNPVYRKGGIMEHKHNVEHVKHHYGKGHDHMHEQEKVSKHYGHEAHKMHHDHVKAMCGGGMSHGKKAK